MSGGGGPGAAVGRPIVFVNVNVWWRDLVNGARGEVDGGDALLVDVLFDDTFGRRHGDEGAGNARHVFDEECGESLAVGGEARSGDVTVKVGEFARAGGGGVGVVKLGGRLVFVGVGDEGEMSGVGGRGEIADRKIVGRGEV